MRSSASCLLIMFIPRVTAAGPYVIVNNVNKMGYISPGGWQKRFSLAFCLVTLQRSSVKLSADEPYVTEGRSYCRGHLREFLLMDLITIARYHTAEVI